ncbi:hypothetical protein BDEG_24150 [Batrachochytrium dendrobatidis JEL423]|uniref:Uncharacterized protein n=1 Tax=Batrachochytrium dendrobatidis (strain JEL423) TaxID=403673 RepID=A0A177WM00_BATDL|nr:hypothetical protein BDEG_24150 [Batrachochytrium dendrobatidis JEL423]
MASTAFGLLSPQTPVRARTLSQLQAPIPSIDIKCVLPLSPIGLVAGNEHCFKAQTHAEPAFGQCDHSTNRSRDKPQDNYLITLSVGDFLTFQHFCCKVFTLRIYCFSFFKQHDLPQTIEWYLHLRFPFMGNNRVMLTIDSICGVLDRSDITLKVA